MIAPPMRPEGRGRAPPRGAEEALMLRENLRLARPFLVLLLLFAVGRWTMGVRGVEYAKGHHVFSLVALTVMSCIFYAADDD